MAQILVRNLEDDVKERIRRQAVQHGHSTAEEVRQILRAAVLKSDADSVGLGTLISSYLADVGFEDGEIEELRGMRPRPADFA